MVSLVLAVLPVENHVLPGSHHTNEVNGEEGLFCGHRVDRVVQRLHAEHEVSRKETRSAKRFYIAQHFRQRFAQPFISKQYVHGKIITHTNPGSGYL